MICESGKVVGVEESSVWVETIQSSSCTACSAKSACGTGLINSIFSSKRHYVQVSTESFEDDVHLHDEVELAIAEHIMLKGSFWVYLLPLMFMLFGAYLGQQWASVGNELPTIIGCLLGFMLSGLLLRWHSHKHHLDANYQPVLHKIIRSGAQEPVKLMEAQIIHKA